MVSLHAFRHRDDVVSRGLAIEYEDPHGLVGTIMDVQLSLQIRRHYISLLHSIGEDHGREPLLCQILLDEQCKLLIRECFLLSALLPRTPAQELEINSLLDAWQDPGVVRDPGKVISEPLKSNCAAQGCR